jgi:DNA-binding IclR family transcriptional regulator
MAISDDYLRQAGEVLAAAASVRAAAATWRSRDPAMRVVVVDAMDMRDETPALTLGQRSVFLATSNGHCWTITQQTAETTALILTQD